MKLIIDNKSIPIRECISFKEKLFGLMFKKNINYGICLEGCSSIHTFFMKEKIDIIMTDKNYKVIYVYNNIKPYRIILPKKKVYYTFELPSNTNTYKINDILKIDNQ